MRNYLLAAVAAAALTSPAMARDKSTYVGVSGGVMLVEDTNLDYSYDPDIPEVRDAVTVDHKLGFDVDLFAGYDFGLVRAEVELAYKRASIDEVQLDTDFVPSPNPTEPYDANGKVSVFSVMGNVLFDFGDEDGWSGFLGAGLGWARVKYNADIPTVFGDVGFSDSDSAIAWQILAGIRKSITPNIDLGLKYRFFSQQAQFRRTITTSRTSLLAVSARTAGASSAITSRPARPAARRCLRPSRRLAPPHADLPDGSGSCRPTRAPRAAPPRLRAERG